MKVDQSVDSANLKVNLLTQEIKFAKMLASNEFNAAIKEKHIKKLSTWLKNRAACTQAFSDKDCLRLWKGLFYSMWMSDKPLPQESLANKIALLLHSFDNVDVSLQFYAMFLKTMAMEWGGIDQWRIDKFMMLVRKVTREMLRIVQANDWDENVIATLATKLKETVLGSNVPRGLFMHFTELYFEEVGKISNGEIESSTVTKLLQPFMFYVASQSDYKLIQYVVRHVFNYLLFQSDAGREYKEKYDAWKMMGFPGNSIDELVLETPVENGENGISDENSENENDDDDDEEKEAEGGENGEEGTEQTAALDPRAGRVDVVMPELKFDPLEIVNVLEDLKYKKFTRVRNRKCIDRIVNTYKRFAGGSFPIGIQKIKINREELQTPDTEDKAVELLQFEEELLGKQREFKKLNKRKRKRILASSSLYEEFQAKSNKIAKLKHDVNAWTEEDITPDDDTTSIDKSNETIDVKESPKKKIKLNQTENHVAKPDKRKDDNAETQKSKKKKKKSEWDEPLQDGETEYLIPSKKLLLNGAQRVVTTKESPIVQKVATPTSKTPKIAGTPSSKTAILETPKVEKKLKSPLKTAVLDTYSTPKMSMPLLKTPKSHNTTPKTTESVEKKVKSASKLMRPINSTPKSAIAATKAAKLYNSTPKSGQFSSAEKKVKIVLQMNKSQEATEYIRQLKQSPNLPYDSAKKPLKGVLKPNLMPSPINPYYKRKIGLNIPD